MRPWKASVTMRVPTRRDLLKTGLCMRKRWMVTFSWLLRAADRTRCECGTLLKRDKFRRKTCALNMRPSRGTRRML